MTIDFLVNILKIINEEKCNINLFSALSLTSIVYNNLEEFISEKSHSNSQTYSENNLLIKYKILNLDEKEKKNLFKKEIAELISKNFKLKGEEVREFFNNLKGILKSLKYTVVDVEITTRTRALVGVSTSLGKLIFDSGISFDPYMNLPYIPASEIKGIVRSYIEDKLGKQEAKEIFGDEEREGSVNFTDAYPVRAESFVFVPDIITPHYNGKKSEADVEPKPIIYLTIAPKVTFRFLIYYKREDVGKPLCDVLPLVITRGLGARSSVGYSLFELSKIEVIR
ncbi:type III-B CRISPR module RAMP protein Cmr6 [Sulfurisphaera ohwakuensis]|uniref:CRISPR-associated protein Cmr6 n=1 Tax=Sulfurisphaera ohwakuensis TaxID=69656 RepID=A0A650CIP5_SULOH|nr:type III-B CRISPR module RAMP protein Cmr6 [Sulfurisphaera ohwakuensis]MBB5253320.1 CRISPR-associated protein Cmr6 [Sulfurisphaera ohwakuensis]QGR17649.1 type III-B CRISPR module RAMP protein Cmr6 [Sulfurisphaera ohwakuensis]